MKYEIDDTSADMIIEALVKLIEPRAQLIQNLKAQYQASLPKEQNNEKDTHSDKPAGK